MRRSTVGQLLINQALPEAMRGEHVLDKPGVGKLFDRLAREHPDEYRDVAKRLADVGRDAATASGGYSFGLQHMRTTPAAAEASRVLRLRVDATRRRTDLDDDGKDAEVVRLLQESQKPVEDRLLADSLAEGNPLAQQVKFVGRGNKTSLKSLRAGDTLYVDHHDRPIPIPALTPYSEGLKPAEYFAASFGARKGVFDVKDGTAKSGFLCLDEETLVRMADGSVKAIKDIRVGDLVIAVNAFGSSPVAEPVVAIHDNGVRDCRTYRFALVDRWSTKGTRRWLDVATLSCTPDHRVLRDCNDREDWLDEAEGSAYAMIPMADWAIGDYAIWHDPENVSPPDVPAFSKHTYCQSNDDVVLAGISVESRPRRTLDLEIAHRDHRFLLANGLIVSNSKQLNQLSHRLVVTGLDHEDDDTGLDRSTLGLPVDTDDPDNEGALLARPAGTYGRNAVLTPAVMADLKAQGARRILVRSPTVSSPRQGGVLARDVGVRERGGLASRGDYVGLAAAQSLGEKMTQGMLSSKHCLHEDTLVRLADGRVFPIKDVMVGDRVVGWDLEKKCPVAVLVTANHDNGERDCWEFRWGEGRRVVATLDHEVVGPAFALGQFEAWSRVQLRRVVGQLAGLIDVPGWMTSPINLEAFRLGTLPFIGDGDLTAYSPGGIEATHVGHRRTRDLTVAHKDHLFVLDCGLIVSNSGGVAGAAGAPTGFSHLNALIQIPKTFPHGAAHAQRDGTVTDVREAPQGGHHVDVEGEEHYVAHGLDPLVRRGDRVEAGDVLSEGIPNPAEIVRHKGIGEGRAHYVRAIQDSFKGSGLSAHRRNVELLAAGHINHVRLDDEMGPHAPGDVVPYSEVEHSYVPRPGARVESPRAAAGKYLEVPVLHHTIGTKVRPSVVRDLEEFGIRQVTAHRDPPPFAPEMVRGMAAMEHDPDWMTRHLGSNLQRSTLEAAHRGRSSDLEGTSYVAPIAERVHFGRRGPTAGWKRDGDRDGTVGDGTPGQRPASSILEGLGL